MKIALAYYFDEGVEQVWGTPFGLGLAFQKKGHYIAQYALNPRACDMSKLMRDADLYDMIFFCWAGPSNTFDEQIKILKSKTKTKIFIEAGDDIPYGRQHHENRVKHVDAIFTPDLRCHIKHLTQHLPSYWLPCWCDNEIFYKNVDLTRQNICVTTCGDRPFCDLLKEKYGDRFQNRRVWNRENTEFFNSGSIVYQYARYGEITRRLFEAGGCGNAIITNRVPADTGIYKMFVEDEDICYFSTEQELLEKMERLFIDHDFRNKLSENMYNKISNKHLVSHRVDRIVEVYKEKI